MDAKDVARKLLEAYDAGDMDAVSSMFTPDAEQHHPFAAEPIVGREAIRENEQALYHAFSDVRVTPRTLTAEGSTVAMEVTLEATNTGALVLGPDEELPATGRSISVPAVWIIEVDQDGMVTEERDYFDTALFFRQLGLQD